ncbi:hypothetical protein HDU85_002193 [Gaertneriomyces sp. JEL0708]|nr:hypothetical protein HDU85_002193 [Gaertneriomyces sp. JEL0708]
MSSHHPSDGDLREREDTSGEHDESDAENRHPHFVRYNEDIGTEESSEDEDEPGNYWCHQCNSQISAVLDTGTPTCPMCGGEFVEEIEVSTDPRTFLPASYDTDEDDDGELVFIAGGGGSPSRPGGGVGHPAFAMHAGTTRSGASQQGANDVANMLQTWLQQIMGGSVGVTVNAQSSHGRNQHGTGDTSEGHAPAAEEPGEAVGMGAVAAEENPFNHRRSTSNTGGTANIPGAFVTGRPINIGIRAAAPPSGNEGGGGVPILDLTAMLESILGAPSNTSNTNNAFTNPFAQMFNMVGNPGDYVLSSSHLDSIITQLMESAQNRSAPPPASSEQITSLPKFPISQRELSEHGECPICQDEFREGETVKGFVGDQQGKKDSARPNDDVQKRCGHIFHPDCIDKWLAVNGIRFLFTYAFPVY